jgi:hypothetical protein
MLENRRSWNLNNLKPLKLGDATKNIRMIRIASMRMFIEPKKK